MKSILKFAGAFIVLLGVIFLAIYYTGTQSNTLLMASLITFVAGLIVHVVLNKKIKE